MSITANAHSPGVALLRHVAEDKQSAKRRDHDGERAEIKGYYSLHTFNVHLLQWSFFGNNMAIVYSPPPDAGLQQ